MSKEDQDTIKGCSTPPNDTREVHDTREVMLSVSRDSKNLDVSIANSIVKWVASLFTGKETSKETNKKTENGKRCEEE